LYVAEFVKHPQRFYQSDDPTKIIVQLADNMGETLFAAVLHKNNPMSFGKSASLPLMTENALFHCVC